MSCNSASSASQANAGASPARYSEDFYGAQGAVVKSCFCVKCICFWIAVVAAVLLIMNGRDRRG
jgi:hypothetical protein